MMSSREYFLFPDPKASFHLISSPLICIELLLVGSSDCLILWGPSQSLARKPYVVSGAEVSVLGIDVDAICADSLVVATILLLVFLGLWN